MQVYLKAFKEQYPEIKITIITFQFPFKSESYKWLDCQVIPLNGKSTKLKKIFVWKKAITLLKKIHLTNSINVIHSFWLGECALIGELFSKTNNIKHICTLMGQDALKGNLYQKLLRLNKNQLVSQSVFQQSIFDSNYKTKSRVISFGIDEQNFTYSNKKTIDIIGIGSLIPLKNYNLFVEIIFEINKTIPINAMIIGDGIERNQLQNKINSLNLNNIISLKGLLSYPETLSHISQAKILLHTSNYEGFGMIFAEALQCKNIIVSRQVGCAFPSEYWHLCNTKNEMIDACKKALQESFPENFINPFTIKKTVENYLKIYNE